MSKLQTEKGPDGKQKTSDIGEEGLLRAAQVGEDLVNEMYYLYQDVRGDQKRRDIKAKYMAIMTVLIT